MTDSSSSQQQTEVHSSGQMCDFTYIFFQDITDADNLMSVVAYMRLFGSPTPENPLHFVLTTRPENFRLPKFLGPSSFKFPGIGPMAWETVDDDDCELLGDDQARRIIMFFHKQYQIGQNLKEACELIRVYDGGCPAQPSNLGHALHARDYLFDRKDLVTSNKDDLGLLLNDHEYDRLQKELNGEVGVEDGKLTATSETEERREQRRSAIREKINQGQETFRQAAGCSPLRPLDDLVDWLEKDSKKLPVIAFAMAALTGFSKLFNHPKGQKIMYDRLQKIFGQLFAWDNLAPQIWSISADAKNIFKNQFNVDCDTISLFDCFAHWCKCTQLDTFFVVPTEVTKGQQQQEQLYVDIHAALRDKAEGERSPIEQLYGLWNAAKANKPQPIFDPAVIFLVHSLKMKGWDITETLMMDVHEVSFSVYVGSSFNWDRDCFAIHKRRPDDQKNAQFLKYESQYEADPAPGGAPAKTKSEDQRMSRLNCPFPTTSTGSQTKVVASQAVINFGDYKTYLEKLVLCKSVLPPSDSRT